MPKRIDPSLVDAVEFNGTTFRRYPTSRHKTHQRYYGPGSSDRKKGIGALHQEIWKYHNGPIPQGWEVHHRDENTLNNSIENLECISVGDHRKEHSHTYSESTPLRAHLGKVRHKAAEWHSSEEGLAWHVEHGRKTYQARVAREFSCYQCGIKFESTQFGSPRADGGRFCSPACAARTVRAEGRNLKLKVCGNCSEPFMGIAKARACSKKCGAALRWKTIGRVKSNP